MQFAAIPGLSDIKGKILQGIKNNHLAHGLLFHGPEGSANLAMALSLSTYLLCQNPGEADACGICPACQKMSKLVHPDLNFAFPQPGESSKGDKEDGKKKSDTVAEFRKFALQQVYGNISDWIFHNGFEKKQLNISVAAARQIIKTLSLKSFEGGYKIMLIWAPEFLRGPSANALLKILEEPPAKTIFMLVTSHPEQLLTTILSRTQKIMVRGFSDDEIKEHLVSAGLCSMEAAQQIAPLADGNMREAYRLVDEVEDGNTVLIRDWWRSLYSKNENDRINFIEQIVTKDKESLKSLLLSGINVIREVLLSKAQIKELMRIPEKDSEFVANLGKFVMDEDKLMEVYQLLNEAHYHIERNAYTKILFTDLTYQLMRIFKSPIRQEA